jgi:stage V sporulation protein R
VRPIAAGEQVSLSVNPYHLGFTLWEQIVEETGLTAARAIMKQDDDFSFIRNYLTRELAADMGLFQYRRQDNGEVKVLEEDIDALRESLLLDKYNFGAPRVAVSELKNDGTLILQHQSRVDGRGLDVERSRRVLEYVQRVWRRPVQLLTVDAASQSLQLTAGSA